MQFAGPAADTTSQVVKDGRFSVLQHGVISPMWITLNEVEAAIRTPDPVEVIGPIEINTEKLVYLRRRHDKLTMVGLEGGEVIMVAEPPDIIHQKHAEELERQGT